MWYRNNSQKGQGVKMSCPTCGMDDARIIRAGYYKDDVRCNICGTEYMIETELSCGTKPPEQENNSEFEDSNE